MTAIESINREALIAVGDVVFREDLYPRIEKSAITVQKYADDLDVLPPIELNQKNELIDGWHRWTAHIKVGRTEIPFIVTQTTSDMHLLELAITRNATHGLQLSQSDKAKMARRIYADAPPDQQGPLKKTLARILSVSERTMQLWTSDIDKHNTEERNAAAFNLWLACHTEQEIAQKVGMSQPSVHAVLSENETFRFVIKPGEFATDEKGKKRGDKERFDLIEAQNRERAEHGGDFEPPIYNVWKQQAKTAGVSHFGNSEVRWLDNLLYAYTQPFDIVVDPFAGSGSTIDLCRKRLRRYWVSDRKPVVEREAEIRLHDLTTGLPPLHNWKDVALVYLDPPYWKQAEGEYSNDPEDLANMPLEQFHKTLEKVIKCFAKKLRPGAVIALMMQATQWRAPERQHTDHVLALARRIDLPVDTRIQCPYESQQCTAQMVTWAKENRQWLVLTRECLVWRVE